MTERDLLGRIPYFRTLTAADRATLGRRCRFLAFPRGATIFNEGEPCEGLLVVAEGRVKIFRVSPNGREQVLHTEGPGATLGEIPLFDGGGYVASAAALGPARLLWIGRRDLETLCRRHPDVALAIIAAMAKRARAFAGLAGDLALRPIQERLALFLLGEARRAGRHTSEGVTIELPGTRDEIAARIGTVREPVSRALSALRRQGLVRLRGKRLVLLDPGRLEEAVGGAR